MPGPRTTGYVGPAAHEPAGDTPCPLPFGGATVRGPGQEMLDTDVHHGFWDKNALYPYSSKAHRRAAQIDEVETSQTDVSEGRVAVKVRRRYAA